MRRPTSRPLQGGAAQKQGNRISIDERRQIKCVQSPAPWRTNSALVNAANDMVIAKIPTQMPLCDASGEPYPWTLEPRVRGGGMRSHAFFRELYYQPVRKLFLPYFPLVTVPVNPA